MIINGIQQTMYLFLINEDKINAGKTETAPYKDIPAADLIKPVIVELSDGKMK